MASTEPKTSALRMTESSLTDPVCWTVGRTFTLRRPLTLPVGFTGASAHLLDIGGAYPGLAIDLVDNWSEGNIYRAVKLADKGVWQESLFKHILENTRTPTHNRGDIEAMIAACERAKKRFADLAARYAAGRQVKLR